METKLRGKTALITGGSSGLGFAIAKSLAGEGVRLAIASRNPLPEPIAELQALGVETIAIEADVSKEDDVVSMVERTIDHFGQLDLYVNNAGWIWQEAATRLTTEAWLNSIHTNLSACVWSCREVGRHMIERRQGSILIIGSTAMFNPLYKETAYRVTKASLKYYMEVLAIELIPYGIRVNMIIPGPFMTRMVKDSNFFTAETERGRIAETLLNEMPMRRLGEPREIGAMAALLLSDELSSFTTGEAVVIDGGLHLRPLPYYSDREVMDMNAVD